MTTQNPLICSICHKYFRAPEFAALLSDEELLSLDGTQEIEVLQKEFSALPKDDSLRPWLVPLAIRRIVARAQLAKVLKVSRGS